MVGTSQNHSTDKNAEYVDGLQLSIGPRGRGEEGFLFDGERRDLWVEDYSFSQSDREEPEEYAICEFLKNIPDVAGVPWVRVLRRAYKSREIAEANLLSHKTSSGDFLIDIFSHSELDEIKYEGGLIVKLKLED